MFSMFTMGIIIESKNYIPVIFTLFFPSQSTITMWNVSNKGYYHVIKTAAFGKTALDEIMPGLYNCIQLYNRFA